MVLPRCLRQLLRRPGSAHLDPHQVRRQRTRRPPQATEERRRLALGNGRGARTKHARDEWLKPLEQRGARHRDTLPPPRRHGEADDPAQPSRMVHQRAAIRSRIDGRRGLDHLPGKARLPLPFDRVETADHAPAERGPAVGEHHVIDISGRVGHLAQLGQVRRQRQRCQPAGLDLQERDPDGIVDGDDRRRAADEAGKQHRDLRRPAGHHAGGGEHVAGG